MRPYEVMVIIDSSLDDDVLRATVDRTTALITAKGGTLGTVERWGRRRLAYEIAKKTEGYYALIQTTAEPAVVAEVDRALHLADEVIRHKIIRLPDGYTGRPVPPPAAAPEAAVESADEAADTTS